jgi:hypothetical protein
MLKLLSSNIMFIKYSLSILVRVFFGNKVLSKYEL